MASINLLLSLSALLFKRVIYVGDTVRSIRNGNISEPLEPAKARATLAVISKQHYFEVAKQFPFSSLKEIRGAVALDPKQYAPVDSNLFFVQKISDSDSGALVNLWFLDKRVADLIDLQNVWFLLPESAVFSLDGANENRLFELMGENGRRVFVFAGADGGVKSVAAKDSFPLESFKRSLGQHAKDCALHSFSSLDQTAAELHKRILHTPPAGFAAFANRVALQPLWNKRQLAWTATSTALLFLLYMFLSLAFPYMHLQTLRTEDAMLSEKVSSVLQSRREVDAYEPLYNALTKPIAEYTPRIGVINLLARTFPKNAKIYHCIVTGNRVEIRGEAEKVSDLLNALQHQPEAANAQITVPTRKDKNSGKEIFSFSFAYQGEKS